MRRRDVVVTKHVHNNRPISSIFRKQATCTIDTEEIHRSMRVVTNSIDIPEELVKELQDTIDSISDDMSRRLLIEGAAPILAYAKALEYVGATLRDGLNIDPGMTDDDIELSVINIAKATFIYRMLCKSELPLGYKRQWMRVIVEKMAESPFQDRKRDVRTNNPVNVVGNLRSKPK